MIDKLLGQLSKDVVDFLAQYDISVAGQYTPNLEGILLYSKNFLARTMSVSAVNIDGSLYQNKLLYTTGTPKLSERLPQNINFSAMAGYEKASQKYIMTPWDDNRCSKVRLPTDSNDTGAIKVRDVSLLDIPIDFCIITESKDMVFALTLLFYQQLLKLDNCELELDLFDDGDKIPIPYFVLWDRDTFDVSYANFESQNALNTVKFQCVVSGAFFSGFYSESHIVNYIDTTISTRLP